MSLNPFISAFFAVLFWTTLFLGGAAKSAVLELPDSLIDSIKIPEGITISNHYKRQNGYRIFGGMEDLSQLSNFINSLRIHGNPYLVSVVSKNKTMTFEIELYIPVPDSVR